MRLGEHLVELRRRLFASGLSIVVGSIVGWFVAPFILDQLREPITSLANDQGRIASLNYTDITAAFDLKIQIAVTVGIVFASPVWLYQVWAFLVPGLTRREIRYSLGFLATAVPLFLAGCVAGWLVFPHIVSLLSSFAPAESTSVFTAKSYFDFVLKLVLVIGVAFVLPLFLVLLNFVGVVSAHGIVRSWRIAILVIVLFTAIATPAADVISMFLLAIPLVVLYFGAAGIAFLHDRRVAKRQRDVDVSPTAQTRA